MLSKAILAVALLAAADVAAARHHHRRTPEDIISVAPSPAPTVAPTAPCVCTTITLTGVPEEDPAPLCPGAEYVLPVVTAEDNCGNPIDDVEAAVDYSTNAYDACATATYTWSAVCPPLVEGDDPDEATRVVSRGVVLERIHPVVAYKPDDDCHYTGADFITSCPAYPEGASVTLVSLGVTGAVCADKCPGGLTVDLIARSVCGDDFDFTADILEVCDAAPPARRYL